MRKIIAILMIALTILTLCAGCARNGNLGTKTQKDEEDEGLDLSIFSYKPDTFCPIATNNEANVRMLDIIYEGLIELTDGLVAVPLLAEDWSVSNDGLTWTVNLKKNVAWHDGVSTFSANDVVYTVNQIKTLENSPYKYNVSNISEVKAVNNSQVKFTLLKPGANFINLLYFPIIKSQAEEPDLVNFKPNGTGPYKFEDRNEGNVYYLVQNPNWWAGKAKAKTIKVKMLPSGDTALYAFGSGGLDLVPAEDMNWGKVVDPSNSAYTNIKTPIYNFLGINSENSKLSMSELRRAISLIVDRDEIIEETRMGYAVAANSPVRANWFISENQKFDLKQNTDAAKRILEEAGWEFEDNAFRKTVDGVKFTADFSILINEENTVRENIARIISKNLEAFGIRTSIIRVSYDEYQKRIQEGNYETFIGSVILPPNLDFSDILGEGNIFNFADEEMQFVMKQMQEKTDSADVKAGYAEFINLFQQLNPIVGLFFEDSVMIYTKQITQEIKPTYFSIYQGIENIQKGELK